MKVLITNNLFFAGRPSKPKQSSDAALKNVSDSDMRKYSQAVGSIGIAGVNIVSQRAKGAKITKESMGECIAQGMDYKEMAEYFGVSVVTIYNKKREYGYGSLGKKRKPVELPKIYSARTLTEDALVNELNNGLKIKDISDKYNCSVSSIYVKMHKYGIPLDHTYKPRDKQSKMPDYTSYTPHELRDRLVEVYVNEEVQLSEKMKGIVEYLSERNSFNDEETDNLVGLNRQIDCLKSKKITDEELEDSKSFKYFHNIKTNNDETVNGLDTKYNEILNRVSTIPNTGNTLNFLLKWQPDKKDEYGMLITEFILSDYSRIINKKMNPSDIKMLEKRSVYLDAVFSGDESLKEDVSRAQKYAQDGNGVVDEGRAANYYEKIKQVKSGDYSAYPKYLIDELKRMEIMDRYMPEYMIKIEDWENSPDEEKNLSGFTKIFDYNDRYEKKLVQAYFEKEYLNQETTIHAKGKQGSFYENQELDTVLMPNVKKEIGTYLEFPHNIERLMDFEDAMHYIVGEENEAGVKRMKYSTKYNWEVKINGASRLASPDLSSPVRFEVFEPEGFHTRKKNK